jgi:hypothetical protein
MNALTRARVSLLLWRGADISFQLGNTSSTLDLALDAENVLLLEKFAQYATASDKEYVINYADKEEDPVFAEQLKILFK